MYLHLSGVAYLLITFYVKYSYGVALGGEIGQVTHTETLVK